MQSRLTLLVRSKVMNRILFPASKYDQAAPLSSSASSHQSHGGSDHPQMELDQGVDTNNPLPNDVNHFIPTCKHDDHCMMQYPKNYLYSSSSKLESPGVKTPFDPHHQQKRTKQELTSCAGIDPWPPTEEDQQEPLAAADDDNDKHYFEHHKASPLSEIEILEKPLGRVTDGTAGGGYFGDEEVITWRPEQLDTAEESLRRATQMFREAAQRGVPDWPHSRRLRQLRGEDW